MVLRKWICTQDEFFEFWTLFRWAFQPWAALLWCQWFATLILMANTAISSIRWSFAEKRSTLGCWLWGRFCLPLVPWKQGGGARSHLRLLRASFCNSKIQNPSAHEFVFRRDYIVSFDKPLLKICLIWWHLRVHSSGSIRKKCPDMAEVLAASTGCWICFRTRGD